MSPAPYLPGYPVVVVNFAEPISLRTVIRSHPQSISGAHNCAGTLLVVRTDWTKDGHMLSVEPISFFLSWEFRIGCQRCQSWVAGTRGCKHLGQSLYFYVKREIGTEKKSTGAEEISEDLKISCCLDSWKLSGSYFQVHPSNLEIPGNSPVSFQ